MDQQETLFDNQCIKQGMHAPDVQLDRHVQTVFVLPLEVALVTPCFQMLIDQLHQYLSASLQPIVQQFYLQEDQFVQSSLKLNLLSLGSFRCWNPLETHDQYNDQH